MASNVYLAGSTLDILASGGMTKTPVMGAGQYSQVLLLQCSTLKYTRLPMTSDIKCNERIESTNSLSVAEDLLGRDFPF
jgi:hypothetical protein